MSADIAPRGRIPVDLPDNDLSDDLFDGQCETLPMPTGAQTPVVSVQPIGPGNPPAATRWKKGGASPNPRGRPPKRKLGTITELMAEEMDGRSGTTHREYLDRSIVQRAAKGDIAARELWEERRARDQAMAQTIAREKVERERQTACREANSHSAAAEQKDRLHNLEHRQSELRDRAMNGGLTAIAELVRIGAVVLSDEEPVIAPQVWQALRRLPPG